MSTEHAEQVTLQHVQICCKHDHLLIAGVVSDQLKPIARAPSNQESRLTTSIGLQHCCAWQLVERAFVTGCARPSQTLASYFDLKKSWRGGG